MTHRNVKTGHLNFNMKTTIWWEPRCPNVIKVCTGDPRFVNDEGGNTCQGLMLVANAWRRYRRRVLLPALPSSPAW